MARDDKNGFSARYRALEQRMQALADADGDAFLPNVEPEGPVEHVLLAMEPSLGRWARSREEAQAKVQAGFRNFLDSIDTAIVHFCVRSYLCRPGERYHITDLSKGAMLTDQAGADRTERYDRWYGLLLDELDLVAAPGATITAFGRAVGEHLERRRFPRPLTRVIHYSPLAGSARKAGIRGHEEAFAAFEDTVKHDDIVSTARSVLNASPMPDDMVNASLARLKKNPLTVSRKQLIFNYKLAFEAMGR